MRNIERKPVINSHKKGRPVRLESNEEIMSASMRKEGYVKLRIAFQIKNSSQKSWAGLKGKSLTLAVKNPGIVHQIIRDIEDFLRERPSRTTRQRVGSYRS